MVVKLNYMPKSKIKMKKSRRSSSSRDFNFPSILSSENQFPKNIIDNTKYTFLNFLPLSFWNLLKQNANKYYILVGILQSIKTFSSVNPWSTWLPLIFIFLSSMTKEFYEHIHISNEDKKSNSRLRSIYRKVKDLTELKNLQKKGKAVIQFTGNASYFEKISVPTSEIKVGDIVEVHSGEDFPCDLAFLYSPNEDRTAPISTANLDGENALKTKKSINPGLYTDNNVTPMRKSFTVERNSDFLNNMKNKNNKKDLNDPKEKEKYIAINDFDCSFSLPEADVHSFSGTIKNLDTEEVFCLDEKNLLPCSCVLKNTEFILGMCVYTGKETKVGLGTIKTRYKISFTEETLNRLFIILIGFQLFIILALTLTGFVIKPETLYHNITSPTQSDGFKKFFKLFIRFFLQTTTLIPISMRICLEFYKILSSKIVCKDSRIPGTYVNNKNIPEELGNVELVLSDKTGTLTQNKMTVYVLRNSGSSKDVYMKDLNEDGEGLKDEETKKEILDMNLYNLALNNNVKPLKNGDFEFTSPDELAFVKAGKHLGLNLVNRTPNFCSIEKNLGPNWAEKEVSEIEIVEEIEFTSERKCSSIIAKIPRRNDKSFEYVLFCKGADEALQNKFVKSDNTLKLLNCSDTYSARGLRAFCLGYKKLSQEEVDTLNNKNMNAREKEDFLEKEVEKDLLASGVVGIEDKLADNVSEVITTLYRAKVKTWMITGDKFSTAEEIGRNCSIISKNSEVMRLEDENQDIKDLLFNFNSMKTSSRKDYSIVIKATTASVFYERYSKLFSSFLLNARSCIFARTAPLQKSMLVKLAQKMNKRVLAIGDGGNDVSMIRKANISVGIRGKEGLRAASAADIEVDKFEFLLPLLLDHGLNINRKIVRIIQISIYKSVFFCFISLIYNFFNGFSGGMIFSTDLVTLYNLALFWPIFFLIFDREVIGKKALEAKEDLISHNDYSRSVKKYYRNTLSVKTFIGWVVRGIVGGAFTIITQVFIFRKSLSLQELAYSTFLTYFLTIIWTIILAAKQASVFLLVINAICFFGTLLVIYIWNKIAEQVFNISAFQDCIKQWTVWSVSLSTSSCLASFGKFYERVWRRRKHLC